MKNTKLSLSKTLKLTVGGILTALVIVLQFVGASIHFGPFSVSLVLIPIVIGAATVGTLCSTWLGLVFGIVVLLSGDAAVFLAISIPGTIITVLLKGTLAGLLAGLVFNLIQKKNIYIATALAAVICPLTNTGIFLLGCKVFFFDTICEWATANSFADATTYMIVGMVGFNFLFELGVNIILCPAVVRIINAVSSRVRKPAPAESDESFEI